MTAPVGVDDEPPDGSIVGIVDGLVLMLVVLKLVVLKLVVLLVWLMLFDGVAAAIVIMPIEMVLRAIALV